MIISNSKKFIFIKTRKCGGTSIQNTLKKICDSSDFVDLPEFATLEFVKKRKRININDYFTFGFTRNPFSVTLSRYLYDCRLKRVTQEPTKENFNVWAKERYFTKKTIFNYTTDGTRLALFDDSGNQIVDFIGKLENIEQDFEIIKEKLNLDKDLKMTNDNRSNFNNIKYRDWVDDETKNLIEEHFKFELDFFNYEF